jgi:two-component system, NtrC family, nitrogen regulation sensor histidine kinase NtrY
MIYKSYFMGVVVRLIIFALLATGLGYCFVEQYWVLLGLIAFFFLISGMNIIYYLNSVNRELAFFFDAIRNEDTTLQFKENTSNKSLRRLHQSMNKVKKHISDIKIYNENNERFFRELLKGSASGLMAVDSSGYIELVNDSALRLLGLQYISHIQLLKQKDEKLYHVLLNLKPGETQTIKILDRSKLRLLSIRASVFLFEDKKFKLFNINDIKSQMEESEMDTWQKMIRVLTHEIMNSVAPITSLGNSLKRFLIDAGSPKLSEDISMHDITGILHGLDVIEERGKGLMDFIYDYRKLAKLPKPVFKAVEIEPWLKKNCLLIQNRIDEENINLEIIRNNNNHEFIGDEKLLSQVLINLLYNAVDALKNCDNKKIVLKIKDNPDGNMIFSVIDNGKGIPQEDFDKIFLPFYTTKKDGSGIGLSLSRQIMRMHKGTIDAHSIPGKQTTFRLAF